MCFRLGMGEGGGQGISKMLEKPGHAGVTVVPWIWWQNAPFFHLSSWSLVPAWQRQEGTRQETSDVQLKPQVCLAVWVLFVFAICRKQGVKRLLSLSFCFFLSTTYTERSPHLYWGIIHKSCIYLKYMICISLYIYVCVCCDLITIIKLINISITSFHMFTFVCLS